MKFLKELAKKKAMKKTKKDEKSSKIDYDKNKFKAFQKAFTKR